MQLELEKTKQSIDGLKSKIEEASVRLADTKRGREDDDGNRSRKLARLDEIASKKQALNKELESLRQNDPNALADLEKELKLVTMINFSGPSSMAVLASIETCQ